MANFQVFLALNGASLPPGSTLFMAPGAIVQGAVILQTDQPLSCRAVSLRADWRTHGRGNTDHGQAFSIMIFQGQIPPGGTPIPFHIQAPQTPWSYNGYYITIMWELIMQCDLGVIQKPTFTFPLVLRPS